MKLSNITKSEYYFYTHDNHILKTVKDLGDYLNSCDEKEYSYHVTSEKNDFSNWILEVLLLPQLAASIINSKSLEESRKIITEFLKNGAVIKEVPENQAFKTVDEYSLRNLRELYYYLHSCNDSNYFHHANPSRNDFSSWVINVLGEKDLGKDLLSAKDLKDAISIIHDAVTKKNFTRYRNQKISIKKSLKI